MRLEGDYSNISTWDFKNTNVPFELGLLLYFSVKNQPKSSWYSIEQCSELSPFKFT